MHGVEHTLQGSPLGLAALSKGVLGQEGNQNFQAKLFALYYFQLLIIELTLIRAEYHTEHVFALKFYAQKDSKSDFKYSNIINRGDVLIY
jgi:hypothetical protein